MRYCASPSAVARRLRRRTGASLVAIDGAPGSGKSTLARALARRLGIRAIHVDKFLRKRRGAYLTALRWEPLRQAIAASRTTRLIDGVCVLEVLDRIGQRTHELLYVQRMTRGIWADAEELIPTSSLDEHLQSLRNERAELVKFMGHTPDSGPSLTEEVIRYHAKYKPHEKATIVYRRADA